jgi:4-hydroxybenzoate polyprenyltransferase
VLAGHHFSYQILIETGLAFVAFSLFASSIYVINDLIDLESDRCHPRKCERPFASGALSIRSGIILSACLLFFGLMLGILVGLNFTLVLFIYLAVTVAYSVYIKAKLMIDICTLAGLYTLRIIGGAAATDIPISFWLLAFSIFFFLSLAAVKRQAELFDTAARGKLSAEGRGYRASDISYIENVATASGYVGVLIMALYLNSPNVLNLYSTPAALWGICLVLLYWISRMIMVAHRGGMTDDPIVYAVTDRVSLICLVLIVIFALAGAVV